MKLLLWALLGFALGGCALTTPLPPPSSTAERLAMLPTENLPVERPVTVHWNSYQVPFIEAETDGDAAFALGLVHAHLRLGQIEIARRVARGRVAEIGGPLLLDTDQGLRILGFDRAAPAIAAAMPAATRAWVGRYLDGLNLYQQRMVQEPHEYRLLGIGREPFTAEDVIAIGRLGATDVNWLVWFNLLPLSDRPEWPRIWREAVARGSSAPFSFEPDRRTAAADLADLLGPFARTGSNSFAVSGGRSASGAPLMANDPHLGLALPNFWIIAGLKSPSFHVVGMTPPGLPVFAFGRNADIAWGGTNLRSAASDLIDVTDLPAERFTVERQASPVRFWTDRTVEVRISPYGPVVSDTGMVPNPRRRTLALHWVGHRPSDELTAMLGVARARDWDGFRAALAEFALPAQNFVYADRAGNIGQLAATRLPRRPGVPEDLVQPMTVAAHWESLAGTAELPSVFNPASGYVASANNPPAESAVPIGWFFTAPDRIERLHDRLRGTGRLSLQDLERLQRDVYSASSVTFRDGLLALAAGLGIDFPAALGAWDGNYDIASRGALAMEAAFAYLAPAAHAAAGRSDELVLIATSAVAKPHVMRLLQGLTAEGQRALLVEAFARADRALARFAGWGDLHRLQVRGLLGTMPLIGARYRFLDLPTAGSQETLMKAAHPLVADAPRPANYGSQSRHLSDLADPDANYFVLMGGQDGWFNSANFLDQVPLWQEGRWIRLPMRPERVRQELPHRTRLQPAPAGNH